MTSLDIAARIAPVAPIRTPVAFASPEPYGAHQDLVSAVRHLDGLWQACLSRLGSGHLGLMGTAVSLQRQLEHMSVMRLRAGGAAVKGIWLAGPGAVGKGEIKTWLRRAMGADVLINATTRAARPSELDGVDYHFMRRGEFLRRREAGEFVCSRHIAGRGLYGLLRTEFERRREGLPVVEESPQVLDRVRPFLEAAIGEFMLVYLLPPDPFLPTLAQRFLHRTSAALASPADLVANLKSTLSLRQARDLAEAIRQSEAGRPVVFLVNDELPAATQALHRHLRGFGLEAA